MKKDYQSEKLLRPGGIKAWNFCGESAFNCLRMTKSDNVPLAR